MTTAQNKDAPKTAVEAMRLVLTPVMTELKATTEKRFEVLERLITTAQGTTSNEIAELKKHIIADHDKIWVALDQLRTELRVIENLASEKKKTISREKKQPATGTPANPPPATAKVPAFPVNKMVYFRTHYKDSAEFRRKYTSDALAEHIRNSAEINAKANETQKMIATAGAAWNFIKAKEEDRLKEIEVEFQTARAEHKNATRPAQVEAEPHTPIG